MLLILDGTRDSQSEKKLFSLFVQNFIANYGLNCDY